MKKTTILIAVFSLLLILNTGCGTMIYTTANSDEPRNSFSELDLYGQWINVPPIGNVWKPNVGYDWSPYNNGQWELTDKGWMWFSDEPYSWIVYHYGSWAFTDSDGWVWDPGYEWYPSRVSWIMEDDYIGWAPLPPAGWNLPMIYDINGSRVWKIVHAKDFDNREINKYRVSNSTLNNRRDWRSSNVPDLDNIRHATGRNIVPVITQAENVRSGKHDLTRVKVIDRNRRNDSPAKPENNHFNVPPPSIEKNNPQRPLPPASRSNNGERNLNKPTVPPVKTKDDLIDPKHRDEKPLINPVERDRNPVDRKKIENPKPNPPEIINDTVRKANEPVIKNRKKPLGKNDLKKQKTNKNKVNPKDDKKVLPEEKVKKENKDYIK